MTFTKCKITIIKRNPRHATTKHHHISFICPCFRTRALRFILMHATLTPTLPTLPPATLTATPTLPTLPLENIDRNPNPHTQHTTLTHLFHLFVLPHSCFEVHSDARNPDPDPNPPYSLPLATLTVTPTLPTLPLENIDRNLTLTH